MSAHRFVVVDSVTGEYLSDQECEPTDKAYCVVGIQFFFTGHMEAALAFFSRKQAFQFIDQCAPLYRPGNLKGDYANCEVHVVECELKEQTKQCFMPVAKQVK